MIQPTIKKQIETAKTMASDNIMIESVSLVDEVDEVQPAGRTESSCSDCAVETGAEVCAVWTTMSGDAEQHYR